MLKNCSVFAIQMSKPQHQEGFQFAICSQIGTDYFSASSADECKFVAFFLFIIFFCCDFFYFYFFFIFIFIILIIIALMKNSKNQNKIKSK